MKAKFSQDGRNFPFVSSNFFGFLGWKIQSSPPIMHNISLFVLLVIWLLDEWRLWTWSGRCWGTLSCSPLFSKPQSFWLIIMVGPACVLFSYLCVNGREENWKRKLLRKRAFLSSVANMYFFVWNSKTRKQQLKEEGRKEQWHSASFEYLKSCPCCCPCPRLCFHSNSQL